MRVRNEDEWLEPSVRSIVGFADQIVIGDNGSTDQTPAIIARLGLELPDLVETLVLPDADICELTNALIVRTRYRWIVRWDGDFVAQTDGPARIGLLRDWLMHRDARRYHMIYLRMVELAGDLWHQHPVSPARADAHCWTASPQLRYVYDPNGYEAPLVPRWFAVQGWKTPCFYHLHIKSDERMFWNYVWKRYLTDPTRSEDATLTEYAERLCRSEFGHTDMVRAAKAWTTGYVQELVRFDSSRYPEHPALVRPHLAAPRYRIVYDGGRIAGRVTLVDNQPEPA